MGSKLSETFLKERYEKDKKYFRVYDIYQPNYKKSTITRKFYSLEGKRLSPDPKIVENVKKARDTGPKQKHPWPETENQWYGWFSEPLIPLDRTDTRFWNPIICNQITKHELKVKQERSRDPKFTGISFKL